MNEGIWYIYHYMGRTITYIAPSELQLSQLWTELDIKSTF